MLKMGSQSGRAEVPESPFGKELPTHVELRKEKKENFYWTMSLILGRCVLQQLVVTCSNTLSRMTDESPSRRTPAKSLPEVTRNFHSHMGESSSQRPCFVQV